MPLFYLRIITQGVVPLPLCLCKTLLSSIIITTIITCSFLYGVRNKLIPALLRTVDSQCRAQVQPLERININIARRREVVTLAVGLYVH